MAGLGQPKTGGRQKGSLNRTTKLVREFFAEVLAAAFADAEFKPRLVKAIVQLELDPKLFMAILNHAAGSPPKQIDHSHTFQTRRLEELVAGVFPDDELEGEEDGGGS